MEKPMSQIFFLLMVLTHCYGQIVKGPKIIFNGNPLNDNFVTLKLSEKCKFDCQSEYKIKWMKLSATSNEFSDLNKTNTYLENEIFHSTWHIEAASVHNISTYYCTYDRIETENYHLEMASDSGASSAVHIFVEDTEHPLVPSADYNLTVFLYSEAIIPCKPSYIPQQIELLREDNSSFGVPYNDTIGYRIRTIDYSLNGSVLICQTRIKNKLFSNKFHLNIIPYRKFVNKPAIRSVSHSSSVINEGDALTLNCSVVVPKAIDYKMKWVLGTSNGTLADIRVTSTNMTIEDYPDSSDLEIGTIQLTIKNISLEYFNVCICQVYDDTENIKVETKYNTYVKPVARIERNKVESTEESTNIITTPSFSLNLIVGIIGFIPVLIAFIFYIVIRSRRTHPLWCRRSHQTRSAVGRTSRFSTRLNI